MSIERQRMEADLVCVGFGPASGAFLTTLTRAIAEHPDDPAFQSKVMPGLPLQILCYERADDIGFGVSGVVTRARGIRETFKDLDISQIPMACEVRHEKVVYLLDPIGASRRSAALRAAEALLKPLQLVGLIKHHALELPYIPPFLRKEPGLILSIGQFNQWVGAQLMGSGLVQIWPGTPVEVPLIEDGQVRGVRLSDQGVDKGGKPEANYLPGMEVSAALTIVGDGPVGAVGRQLDDYFGLPPANHQHDWAVGMKMLVELPEGCPLEAGTVIHTIGFPEPEIFGFLYVYPNNTASLGIFLPSWFKSPVRTTYRYLQHWMQHPYLWRYLQGGTLRSWGAKSLQESGRRGEPHLAGEGYARIGEGSGSTNVLAGSGVDEAWMTGTQLAEGVIELLKAGKPFTRENLEQAYVARRRRSVLDAEAIAAARSRDGFQAGFLPGLIGMTLAGFTKGKVNFPAKPKPPQDQIADLEQYYTGRISGDDLKQIRQECAAAGQPLHDAIMERVGWPKIQLDGKLLVSHQDALLMGGKVQAAAGFADHVRFIDGNLCRACETKVCIELCSAQAITVGEGNGVPAFDREKCVHCGACLWNCAETNPEKPERGNIDFRAGAGGLHSAEN